MTQTETQPLEQHLTVVLATILEDKETRNVAPVCADIQEIMAVVNQDVKEALNNMVKHGVLTFHRTLNSTTFEFAPLKR
ncbi:MAG: hypothetical protein K2H46_02650 [Muribaculaceae bacterium]|nr:hypothetical protein [Muribaculaceae bacterium]